MSKKKRAKASALPVILILIAIFLLLGKGKLPGYEDIEKGIVPGGEVVETEKAPVETAAPLSTLAYDGSPSVQVNGNVPSFTDEEKEEAKASYIHLSELDSLGRCTAQQMSASKETMPKEGEERGSIGMIKPSGWQTVRYDGLVEGNYLYNRCHLLGWAMSSLNDEPRNLITGTRYMNAEGMLPYEIQVLEYLDISDNHVLYRVTPIYEGDNLVASGVLMEAYSVEDGGAGVSFSVYCYNVQPGVTINYANGLSERN